MIAVDFIGRLGNQMFTYAFVRMLLDKEGGSNHEIIANFKRCGDCSDGTWGDCLQHFKVHPYTTTRADSVLKYGTVRQRIVYLLYMLCTKIPVIGRNDRLMSSIERHMRRYGIFYAGAADEAFAVCPLAERIFVRGYFQDRRFFHAIRPLLLKEFQPKLPPLSHNADLYRAAMLPNSVCVSVRRGDYLSPQYKKDFYVCTPEYYQAAIKAVCQRVPHPTFIFFSDDIGWVRDNMAVKGLPCYYERGDDPVWETLRLMYSCHHFIISNSTFAWWAQYLGNREGKITICPSRWFANPKWHSHLINDNFLFL